VARINSVDSPSKPIEAKFPEGTRRAGAKQERVQEKSRALCSYDPRGPSPEKEELSRFLKCPDVRAILFAQSASGGLYSLDKLLPINGHLRV